MNKNTLIGLAVLVVVAAGALWYLSQLHSSTGTESTPVATDQTTQGTLGTTKKPVTGTKQPTQPAPTQTATNTPASISQDLSGAGIAMTYPSSWKLNVTANSSAHYMATLNAANGGTVATIIKENPAADLAPYDWTTSQLKTSGPVLVTKYVGTCRTGYCTQNQIGEIVYSIKLSDGSNPRIMVLVGTWAGSAFTSFDQASATMDPVVLSIH